MDMFDLAGTLFGNRRDQAAQGSTLTATGSTASADGIAGIVIDADVTPAEGIGDEDADQTVIDLPTSPDVAEGDEVIVTLVGYGPLKTPVVTANPGSGDRMAAAVQDAHDLAASVEGIAQEAAAEVEQVRQDVADFKGNVYTKAQTDKKVQDLDDAISTELTTNYTNSNDLATTYATKTLVSQTKDAIELAASQTYETQSGAAATYATQSALTVGLDGIRTEVAEDYQPKGDYATTASMNSAIQQSASSIETRITTATNTANSAKSAVDNLQVGGTNLMLEDGIGLWPTAYCFMRSNLSEPIESGVPYVLQLWDVDVSNSKKTAAQLGVYVYYCGGNVRIGGWQGTDYFTNGHADHLTLHFTAYTDKVTTSSGGNVSANLNLSHSSVTSADPKNIQLYNSPGYVSGAVMNCTIGSWKLERGTLPTDWSPAPEDMATEADLQAEVTERQTLIRQFSGGVLAGYVGNAIAALVNAAGSFDVVEVAWANGVPSILSTLATFGANLIRIGGKFASSGESSAKVQFFEDNSALTDLTATHYINTADNQIHHTLALSSTVTDEDLPHSTSRMANGVVEIYNSVYNDGTDYSDEVDVSLGGGTTNRNYGVSLGVRGILMTGNDLKRIAYAVADTLQLTYGTASQAIVTTIPMQQVIVGLTQPGGTWTGNNNTATDPKNGWRVCNFTTRHAGVGAWSSYFTLSGGTITALKDVVLEISGNMYWNSAAVAQYGFGLWSAANFDSEGYISGGASGEISNFSYKGVSGGQFSVPFPPRFVYMAAGSHYYVCRYTHSSASFRNGNNMTYITIKVIEDRSGGAGSTTEYPGEDIG